MVGSNSWWFASADAFYNGATSRSAKFNDGDSDHLTFTPSSANGQTKCTISAWVKRCNLGAEQNIFHSGNFWNNRGHLRFNSDNTLEWAYSNGSWILRLITSAVYRDVSSWYHIVARLDTTDGTADIYVNNTIQTLQTSVKPSSSQNTSFGQDVEHQIGERGFNTTGYFDGYLADVNFINGTDLTASSFGETKEGSWIPKSPSGITYGTNGFRLEFKQTGTGTASTSTVGADTSGNTNHFTSSGHPTGDIVDNPENNFCTLNIEDDSAGTFSEGNLRYDTSAWDCTASTFMFNSGKWYFEARADSYNSSAEELTVGIMEASKRRITQYWHHSSGWTAAANGYVYGVLINGTTEYKVSVADDTAISDSQPEIVADCVIGIAIDLDSGTTTIKYNVDGGTFYTLFSSLQATDYTAAINSYTAQVTLNFGQDSTFAGQETAGGNADGNGKGNFHSAVPSGYLALCSANLDEPLIGPNSDTNCDEHFNAVIYTGNGSTQNITGVGHQPDLIWIKNRDASDAHVLTDSTRGVTKELQPNATGAESTNADGVTAFGSDGFSLGDDDIYNTNTEKYVSWNWKIGGASTSSHEPTGASAAVTMQRNTTAGISMIRYLATGTNVDTGDQTLGHGLQVDGTDTKPDMMIFKAQTEYASGSWAVWHKDMGGNLDTDFLLLNSTAGTASTSDNIWGGTSGTYGEPTTTLAYIGYDWNVNKGPNASGTGNTAGYYMGYFFASIEGFSKFGSYIGNGSANGTFVYTGFRPAFVITKRTDSADNWVILDSGRSTYNARGDYLYIENSQAEDTHSTVVIDFLSNGFKCRGTATNINASGGAYVYIAFAEAPFKYANAG